jgi:hypothetical protein
LVGNELPSVPLDTDPLERFVGRKVRTPWTSAEQKREVGWKTRVTLIAAAPRIHRLRLVCSSPGAPSALSGSQGGQAIERLVGNPALYSTLSHREVRWKGSERLAGNPAITNLFAVI